MPTPALNPKNSIPELRSVTRRPTPFPRPRPSCPRSESGSGREGGAPCTDGGRRGERRRPRGAAPLHGRSPRGTAAPGAAGRGSRSRASRGAEGLCRARGPGRAREGEAAHAPESRCSAPLRRRGSRRADTAPAASPRARLVLERNVPGAPRRPPEPPGSASAGVWRCAAPAFCSLPRPAASRAPHWLPGAGGAAGERGLARPPPRAGDREPTAGVSASARPPASAGEPSPRGPRRPPVRRVARRSARLDRVT